ncbi:hypothetical protein A2757_03800 [Candidatus Giovannonibacteria bacterium RIFCSPHIGHO2_01_FULL_48_47]|nr:MAG: hypothetical protein A2757_03800 [Candidatus Giovannonibacteria bacterium RIFCSPHIGHO2_01_FULL_48_47]OGF68725.1 MAG: hypothetical protein A3D61_01385 [Candidatus Giovannonibacteria bacterium RIFCSPHIGHO2_02_FULL_48_15]OGF89641.1 MAG: hypothetical protein A3B26_02810 [Candidatus Giovannonibacteria bacterium RIFCSPLOWO2_01_FULL_48_47]OGF95079.1 MAG: hypothetical protein A2433_01865 [Candidatus Giovannonibacteria bacterium RIFOXYC1_FULL_48_8]OGF96342.1 MAG: hypothetical protein A2613_02155
MKVLGIDPGIERLGWAVIEGRPGEIKRIDSGVKRTSKTKPKETRLFEIQSFVESKILEAGPEILCLEKIIFAKNAKTAFVIGEVRGILLALAGKYGLKTKEFTPIEVKKTISGYGRADKEAVLKMLEKIIELPSGKILDDESDALAIACSAVIHSGTLQKN